MDKFDVEQYQYKVRDAEKKMVVSSILSLLHQYNIPVNSVKYIMAEVEKEAGRHQVQEYGEMEKTIIQRELDQRRDRLKAMLNTLHQNKNVELSS